ncbi:hypothetical protein Dda_3906 [Drechslerella dactyloides]|uniref:Exosome complex protein n=1 Tax=Drechslerella dactyloides TaxID=74499 RepID=A0AAD6IYS2_DREDA|nr:hypothetical protein Dda_3906 [Drechslerella dactyloides]
MESELWPALDDLEDGLDELSKDLKPLLEENLPKNAAMLPLFDKAKLYIMTTYALESLLWSYLDLSAAANPNHPIMKELTRVRQYFQKIRDIESKDQLKEKQQPAADSTPAKHVDTRDNLILDKAAAGRFISAALAGNEKYDEERAENIRQQKERAQEKFAAMGEGTKDPVGERAANSDDSDDEGGVRLATGESDNEAEKSEAAATPTSTGKTDGTDDAADEDDEAKKARRAEKKRKRELEAQSGDGKKKKKSKKDRSKKKDKAKNR